MAQQTWFWVDVHSSYCHKELHGYPRFEKPPKTMLMFESFAVSGAILVWVTCAAIGAMVTSGPELLLRAISRFMYLLQLGSVMMSMVHVATVGSCMMNSEGHAEPALLLTVPGMVDLGTLQ